MNCYKSEFLAFFLLFFVLLSTKISDLGMSHSLWHWVQLMENVVCCFQRIFKNVRIRIKIICHVHGMPANIESAFTSILLIFILRKFFESHHTPFYIIKSWFSHQIKNYINKLIVLLCWSNFRIGACAWVCLFVNKHIKYN